MKGLEKMKVWTTRGGIKIPYNSLTLNHIYNIIKYARTYGFSKQRISTSIVDNTDGIIFYEDISNEVIEDMLEELLSRKVSYVYYLEKQVNGEWKKISSVYTDRAEIHDILTKFCDSKECHIVKEVLR